MKKLIILYLLIFFGLTLSACTPQADTPPEDKNDETCLAPSDYSEELTYELIWEDNFDGTELNSDYWTYEVNGDGGGNQELQYYTNQNTEVSDGTLKIIAKKEVYQSHDYTSSRIVTKNKMDFKYGIVEARAKVPAGVGTWPAIWMMPTYSRYGVWPRSGEIDIMEHVGFDHNHIHQTLHTRFNYGTDGKGGGLTSLSDVTENFHVYKVEWLPDKIIFSVNDEHVYTYNPNKYNVCTTDGDWPFNSSFFLIMNVAIGGTWGGAEGVDDTIFPVQMEVDYIRLYQATELDDYNDQSE